MGDQAYGAAGAVVGGVIGYFAGGNVVAGAQIGYAIGSQVDAREANKKAPKREPELQNKQTTAAEYGSPIPMVYGTAKVNGILIWGLDLFQQVIAGSDDPGGKGGGGGSASAGQNTAKYQTFARFAVKLCKGPIVGVSRIWLDNKLYVDARANSLGALSRVEVGSTSGEVQSGKESIAYSTSGGIVTVYTGTETQPPDSYLESHMGIGNVNAHRGDAYLVFTNLLVDAFGKRIPNVTAEVIVAGDFVDTQLATKTLDEPTPLPDFPVRTPVEGRQLMYDPFSGNIIWIAVVLNYSTTPFSRLQVQAINPVTHTTVYSVTVSGHTSGSGFGGGLRQDTAGPYVWVADKDNVYAISTFTGAKVCNTPRSYAGFDVSQTAIALSVPDADELWISNGNGNFVFSRSAILSGSTLTSAYKRTVAKYSSSGKDALFYIPHRKWVVARTNTHSLGFYDVSGNKIAGPYSQGSYQIYDNIAVDSVNDCLWLFLRLFAPDERLIYKFDLSSLTFTLITSGCSYGYGMTLDTNRNALVTWKFATDKLEWYDETGTKIKEVATSGITGDAQSMAYSPTVDELAFNVWESLEAGRSMYAWKLDKIDTSIATIDDVVIDVSGNVGVDVSDIEVTALSAEVVSGYAIDARTQARSAIEPLKRIGLFDLVQEDGKVKARKFGGASVMTINHQDLLIEDGSDNKRPYSTKRANEIDLPQSVEVAYSDVTFDYETQIQSASRSTRLSKSKSIVTIPAAITADAAKKSAQVALYQAWASRTAWTLNASRKHWALNIGDAFTFVDELGASRRLLCVAREMLGMTRMTITAIEDDASVYTSIATGSAPTWTPPVIAATTLKRLELLDVPIMRDQDDYPGFYAIADSSAPSASLYESIDGGITYNLLGVLQEADTGYATTTLANFTGGNVWDDVSTLTVTVYSGTLESVTDAQVLAGLNAALVGNEVIQYTTATLISANTYTLSRLLRGRKGTEWAIGLHGTGERFVPLPISMGRINSPARGALRYYKAVRNGASIADAPVIAFTNAQVGMKPYSVVSIAGSRDGSNNLTITWARRSRIGTAWGLTDALPLDDTVESYQVDIMSGSVVKRTISSSTPTCAYSAADQTTDFGGVQLSLLVNVYQMSTIVGRGTVSVKTI